MSEVSGLTPRQWESRLEGAAADPESLASSLAELEREIHLEHTFLHENPEPDNLISMVLDFFGVPDDNDLSALGKRIEAELSAERWLKERYRSWMPGEEVLDRLFPYVKNFGADVREDAVGIQFPGYYKYKGIRWGRTNEVYALFLSKRFPGREPANFHLLFRPLEGNLVIKRVYRRELPWFEGITTPARAVLAEMARDIVPSIASLRVISVDNAANVDTRQALIVNRGKGDKAAFDLKPGGDAAATPLGKLMTGLAADLGLAAGDFQCQVCNFGTLRIGLSVASAGGPDAP